MKVVERFLAYTIAGQEQFPRLPIVQGECEHPVEAGKGGRTPLPVGMEDHFRVGIRPETETVRFEKGPDFPEIVDLAVEDDYSLLLFVLIRLVCPFTQVEYGKPPMAEAQEAIFVDPPCIRPPMAERIDGLIEILEREGLVPR